MARARNLKPGFFTNDLLAECEPLARLLFQGLWCHADREGRMEYRPKKFKAEILPYDDCRIDALLDQLKENNFIEVYEVSGIKYLQVVNFCKHQNPHIKEQASSIPAPDKPGASPVQEPEEHGSCPSDSLLPLSDSINPIHPTDGADAPALDQLFSRGIEILTSRGVDKKNVRAFLGLMRKRVGDVKAMELLLMVDEQDISAPIAWLTKVMDNRKTNHEYKSQRDKVADTGFALTGSYRPTERVIEGTATAVS